MNYAKLFFETRSELKLSRERFARALDVSSVKILSIERGKSNPTVKDLQKIADMLKCPLFFLIAKYEGVMTESSIVVDKDTNAILFENFDAKILVPRS